MSRLAENKTNLYLVGFMGTGKTSVGRNVARALKMKFIDSDKAIETAKGLSVCGIFQDFGEEHFRELEREFIVGGHPQTGVVVACGGGLLQPAGMLECLQKRGVVITLFASPDTILSRTKHRDTRPMLNVDDKEARIRELLDTRQSTYLKAGPSIMTDARPLTDVVKHAVRIYQREAT